MLIVQVTLMPGHIPTRSVLPTAPAVTDACGNTITPTVVAPSPITCNGMIVYTFPYIDCVFPYTTLFRSYTISAPDFTLPADGSSTVNCPANAVLPTAPAV